MVMMMMFMMWSGEIRVTNAESLETALLNIETGQTIVLADGHYDLAKSEIRGVLATPSRPLTLRAENRGRAVLTGAPLVVDESRSIVLEGLRFEQVPRPGKAGAVLVKDSRGVVFQACTFDFDETNLTRADRRHWVVLQNSPETRIDHCDFYAKMTRNARLRIEHTSHRAVVTGNLFRATAYADGGNGFETIQLGTGEDQSYGVNLFAEVFGNYFYACDGEAEIISAKTSFNRIYRNTFLKCRGQVVLRMADHCEVFENFFLNDGVKEGVGGVRIHGNHNLITNNYFYKMTLPVFQTRWGDTDTRSGTREIRYRATHGTLVAHNTVFDTRAGIVDFGDGTESRVYPSMDWVFANNLWIARGRAFFDGTAGSGLAFHANLADQFDSNEAPLLNGNFSEAEIEVLAQHPLVADNHKVFRLAPGARGVDEAVILPFWNAVTDLDGVLRDGAPDIGADEVSSAGALRVPLTSKDVGPTVWKRDE